MSLALKKSVIGSVVALAICSLSADAFAATAVTYYTIGTFSGTGTLSNSVSIGGTSSVTIAGTGANAGKTVKLEYDFQPITSFDWADLNSPTFPHFGYWSVADFGAFQLTRSATLSAPGISFAGVTFTMSVYQLVPGAGSGALTGTISGSVTGSTGSGLTWSPVPNFVIPPPAVSVQYTIQPPSGVVSISATTVSNPNTTVKGEVELGAGFAPPVPLPAVANMGIAMFGLLVCGLAGKKLARRAAVV